MPFTFVEIEERKTRQIALLFVAVILLYTASILALIVGVRLFLGVPGRLSGAQLVAICGVALLAAAIHWASSTYRLVDRVLAALLARPLDPGDTYHQRFRNIVEEISVATGGHRRIEPYVISTPAMNACAISDFGGRSAIAVTEGLLARLNRAQLEAVVGHEAAHVACGDSLVKSVFCGLFGLHEEALKRLSGMFSGRSGVDLLRGRAGALMVFVMAVLWVSTQMKRVCELLVSREQEYRADATAVRLTREPLSLAEALHVLSRHWRGVGTEGESLSIIFIMDPGTNALSERDGLLADGFSTHPPTERRIAALVGMSGVAPTAFAQTMTERDQLRKPRVPVPQQLAVGSTAPPRWLVRLGDEWRGPFGLEELTPLKGLSPDSWVRRETDGQTRPAHADPQVLQVLHRRYARGGPAEPAADGLCPICHVPLARLVYEGVPIDECPACGGCYMMPDQVSRILTREDYEFPEPIQRLAKAMPSVRSPRRVVKRFGTLPYNRLERRQCPKCGSAVVRKFYTEAYLVEVEQCWVCGLAWFDKDERELIQYLYEHRAMAEGRPTDEPQAL